MNRDGGHAGRLVRWLGAFALVLLVAQAKTERLQADGWLNWCCCCQGTQPQTPEERMARAGCPQCISRIAHTSDERADCGYYVGGAACGGHGDERYPHEGTWGWDYAPWYSHVRVGWTHGRSYGGGEGQYQQNRCNNPIRDFYKH
jgi:hypothetical protein